MTTLIDTQPAPLDLGPLHPRKERWSREAAEALMDLPFLDLLLKAQAVHRENFAPNRVQMSRLHSIKTGGCAEDCGYCSQSAKFETGLKATKLDSVQTVLAQAATAKADGSERFCMGAAWRSPKGRDMDALTAMIRGVKEMGLETCMEDYGRVISTRTYEDRLATLNSVRAAGMKVCCGGIVGMGETPEDRLGLLLALANLDPAPESVPINALVPVPGTPLGDSDPVEPFDSELWARRLSGI